jgi:hypothetical protein
MLDRRREKIQVEETINSFANRIDLEKFPKRFLKKGYVLEVDSEEVVWIDLKKSRMETNKEFKDRCEVIDIYEKMEEEREYSTYLRLKQKYENGNH